MQFRFRGRGIAIRRRKFLVIVFFDIRVRFILGQLALAERSARVGVPIILHVVVFMGGIGQRLRRQVFSVGSYPGRSGPDRSG